MLAPVKACESTQEISMSQAHQSKENLF